MEKETKIIKRGKLAPGSTNFGSMRGSNKGSLKADKQKVPSAAQGAKALNQYFIQKGN